MATTSPEEIYVTPPHQHIKRVSPPSPLNFPTRAVPTTSSGISHLPHTHPNSMKTTLLIVVAGLSGN